MARANRHFIPGYVWHLTHRCHKKEFLLKFSRDRFRWMELLFEAKSRFRLSILNFIVTSNHIHLIVSDNGVKNAIPQAMQLIAGRTGQEYNRRKGRKGAFWEDRYHATAVESNGHLWKCMVYIDLNMVRAGVVSHPSDWKWSGYHEIQKPKQRYRVIDHGLLMRLLSKNTHEALVATHRRWIESQLGNGSTGRLEHWSQSVAVGSKAFVEKVKSKLCGRAKGRAVEASGSVYQLKESITPYGYAYKDQQNADGIITQETNLLRWRQSSS